MQNSITKLLQTTKAFVNLRLVASFHTSDVLEKSRFSPQKIEEQLGIPDRPKRPQNAFFRFLNEHRAALIKENPHLRYLDIPIACAAKWSETDATVKIELQKQYQREKIDYLKKLAEFESRLTDEQKARLKAYKKDLTEYRAKRALRKKQRLLGRPPKPATNYNCFLRERFKDFKVEKGSTNYHEIQTKITAEWNSLTKEEKEVYKKNFAQDTAKFYSDLEIWEAEMIRLGHKELVRTRTLLDGVDATRAERMKESKRRKNKLAEE